MNNKNTLEILTRFKADIDEITKATGIIQKSFDGLKPNASFEKSFLNTLTKLENEIKTFESKAARGISSTADSKALEKSGNKIIELYGQIKNQIKVIGNLSNKELQKLFPDSLPDNLQKAYQALSDYEAQITKTSRAIEKENDKIEEQKKLINELNKQQEKNKNRKSNIDEIEYSSLKNRRNRAKGIYTRAEEEKELIEKKIQTAVANGEAKITKSGTLDRRFSQNEELIKELDLVSKKLIEAKERYQKLEAELEGKIPESAIKKEAEEIQSKIESVSNKIEEAEKNIEDYRTSNVKALNTIKKELNQLSGLELNFDDLDTSEDSIRKIDAALDALSSTELAQLKKIIDGLDESVYSSIPALERLRQSLNEVDEETKDIAKANQELENVKNNVLQFFSVGNAIQLFKRAVTSAFETVKELDAAMTEIAVVSEFEVSDMWNMLPQFTEQANKLGVAVKEAYSGTTLFVQQGLEVNNAMEISAETLKMARIAGMDAAAATDAMTAALRGFNMELSETSAQRVNDVYSKLAAITASDTHEISTAMTKTASIAHNANMEFETTSAFLSQIIETTREAPETAGTALKTVIARFQELKKDPGQITEVDGEVVDANKIEGALRTIGVALRDTSGQFKALDEVFLEIASKWDSLDTNTQRYIATVAAGSRQQSRFIAMMSDYDRTMELVNAANNSAGASQEQFGKTLDSLESKLARLRNAWNEFTMGLANSEVIKVGVDTLTKLLDTINKISDAFGEAGSGIVKLAIAFGAIKGGKTLFSSVFSKNAMDIFGTQAKSVGANAALNFGQSFAHKLETTKIYSEKSGTNFLTGFFKDTSGLKLPKGLLDKPINELFKTVDPKNIKLDVVQKALEHSIEQTGINWEKADFTKEHLLDLVNKGDLENLTEASEKIKKIGIESKITGEMVNEASGKMKTDMLAVAGATVAAGAAFSAFGTFLKDQGFEEAGQIITKLGGGLAAFGTIMSVVIPMHANIMAKKTTAAILSIPVIGVITGIITALTTLGFIISDVVETSTEKTKRLADEAKAMKIAADTAKSAYEELLSSFDEYDTAQNTLEKLVRGTDDWRKALVEVNNQVIELLQEYPELAKYVERGQDGQLTINEKGRSEFVENQKQGVIKMQQASISAEAYKTANDWTLTQNRLNTLLDPGFGTETKTRDALLNANLADLYAVEDTEFTGKELYELYGINKDKAQKIWEAEGLQDNWGKSLADMINSGRGVEWFDKQIQGLSLYSDALYDIAVESSYSAKYLYSLKDTIADYTTEQIATEEKMKGYASSILALGASDALSSSEYAGQIQEIFADTIDIENFDENLEEAAEEYTGKKWDIKKLTEEFLDRTGLKELPQELKEQGEDGLRNALAGMDLLDSNTEQMNQFYEQFIGLSKEDKNKILRTIKKDGQGFNKQMADAYIKLSSGFMKGERMSIDEYFKNETGFELEQIASSMGMTAEEFRNLLIDNAKKTEEAFNEAKARLTAQNFVDENGNKIDIMTGIESSGISAGAFSGLTNNLYQLMLTGGTEATKTVATNLGEILNNLSPEDAENFAIALNMVDWSSQSSIRSFSEVLKDLNVTTNLTDEKIAGFEEQIIELGNISKNVTFDSLKEELKSLGELEADIEKRDSNELSFTDDEKEILMNAGIDDSQFVLKGIDEWVYIGGSLESLLTKIGENTDSILKKMTDDLDEAIKQGTLWKEASKANNIDSELTDVQIIEGLIDGTFTYGNWTNPNAERTYTTGAIKRLATSVGVDIEGKDIQGIIDSLKVAYDAVWGKGGTTYDALIQRQEAETRQSEQMRFYQKETGQEMLNEQVTSTISEEARGQVFDAIIAEEKLQDVYNETAKSLKKYDEALLKAHVIDSKKSAKQIGKLREVVSKNADTLRNAGEDNYDYGDSLSEIREAAQEVFGEENITDDFIETHKEDFILLAEGGAGAEEAFNRISEAISEELLSKLGIVGEKANEIKTIVAQLDGLDLSITSTVDFSDAFNQLAILMGNAENAAEYLESLGYEVTVKQTGVKKVLIRDAEEINGNFIPPIYEEIPMYQVYVGKVDSQGAGGPTSTSGAKTAENKYDKQYNLIEDIDEKEREHEKITRDYNNLLENREVTGQKLLDLSNEELKNLEKQKELQEKLKTAKEKERQDLLNKNSKFSKYAWYDNDGTISINWGEIDKLAKKNPDKYEEVVDYISELEEIQGQIEEAEDVLLDIEDNIKDIKERGKEEYEELETRVLEALIYQEQQRIDNQEKINEAIDSAATDLIDAIQSSIDKLRQDRENEKTEESLAEKERRLAYLRQDTSGANAMEIKRLEEEIANEREEYGDSLVDQALQDLQNQNDEAAQQRERQIKLLQDQLTWAEKNGAYNAEVKRILSEGILNGPLDETSKLFELLKDAENISGLGEVSYEKWLTNLRSTISEAYQYKEEIEKQDNTDYMALMMNKFASNGGKIDDEIREWNKIRNEKLDRRGDLEYDRYNSDAELKAYLQKTAPKPESKPATNTPASTPTSTTTETWTPKIGEIVRVQKGAKIDGKTMDESTRQAGVIKDYPGGFKVLKDKGNGDYLIGIANKDRQITGTINKKYLTKYKQGGLADFTGPAWLDGTKSRPEMVLNAQDTENFLILKDVLSSLLHLPTVENSGGDSYFDIDIQVDELSSDYDVDQMVERIKQKIYEDSMYRNNNSINLLR